MEQGINFIEQAIFGEEQGLLLFFALENGSNAAVDSFRHFNRKTWPISPINQPDSARKSGLTVKENTNLPRPCAGEDANYVCN
jgi:hypothetical protein